MFVRKRRSERIDTFSGYKDAANDNAQYNHTPLVVTAQGEGMQSARASVELSGEVFHVIVETIFNYLCNILKILLQIHRILTESGTKRPDLIDQHLVRLVANVIARGLGVFRPPEAAGGQREKVLVEESEASFVYVLPEDRQDPAGGELVVLLC